MTSLLPALLRTFYINEPIFRDARVVYSAYDAQVANSAFDGDLRTKALDNGFGDVVDSFYTSNGLDLNAGASKLSDGTIAGVEDVALENLSGLILDYQEDLSAKYLEFYEELLEATEEKV